MKKVIKEGFKPEGSPDMKYYAFDWDDNIVHMPTKIILKSEDGDEVGMSTDDFAEFRGQIGKEPFTYNGDTIVGFAENPFRNFTTEGDKEFLIDAMRAKVGPAFSDFREAINNGSIFAIKPQEVITQIQLKREFIIILLTVLMVLIKNHLLRT